MLLSRRLSVFTVAPGFDAGANVAAGAKRLFLMVLVSFYFPSVDFPIID
jgi:hypothetical protein